MNVPHFTFAEFHGIIPALEIQGWSDDMAMSANERARNYQRRQAAKRLLLSEEEQAVLRAERLAKHKEWRTANIERAREIARESVRRQRRAKAAAEGREFGRVGIEIAASSEEKAARAALRREKKRAYDVARYAQSRDLREKKIDVATAKYWADPETVRTRMRGYYETHKEEYIAQSHKRRARVTMAGGSYAPPDLVDIFCAQRGTCLFCMKPFDGKKPHIDHWIPVVKGGTSNPENLALLHAHCNAKKAARLPSEFGLPNSPLPLRLTIQNQVQSDMDKKES